MKKIFGYMSLFIAAASSLMVSSCKDSDEAAAGTDRQFMTMFITDNTRGKGDDYPYNCGLDSRYPHGNTIHLYWYGVNNCAGYQIQMALPIKVANGAEAWAKVQGTPDLLLDTIVGPDKLDLVIENLQYKTDYRFAIRALDTRDENIKGDPSTFAHASNWFGHGNGRQWQEYMGIETKERYATPTAIFVNQALTTEHTITVGINSHVMDMVGALAEISGVAEYNEEYVAAAKAKAKADAEAGTTLTYDRLIAEFPKLPTTDQETIKEYYDNFNIEADGTFGFQKLRVVPSPNNPNSEVDEKWKDYTITDADREAGKVVITGLTSNSVYVIDVVDPREKVAIDAKYNTCTTRSDGVPGDPILLKHDEMIAKYNNEVIPNNDKNIKRSEVFELAEQYDAAPISNVLYEFISDTKYAEGQTFLLEGGKTYYIDGNDITCKGFVLRTDPKDVAEGKRAKVIAAIGKNSQVYESCTAGEQWQGPTTMFMFGRQPEVGEGGEIYMKKLAFYDIDFDNPKAINYTDNLAGVGTITGNYFFNMYSNGMAVTLDSLVISNCTFKRLIRGFIREQGPNYKVWNHVLIENNQFMDCGPYSNTGGGYPWIAAACNNANTNLYKDFKFIGNTIFDCPISNFLGEATTLSEWKAGPWKITFSNNTIINFNTRAAGYIFRQSYMPDGSVYTVENNLFAITKKPGDVRTLGCWGANMSETSQPLEDGTYGRVTLIFNNNVSTNDNLTNGQVFSANTFAKGFQNLIDNGCATLIGDLNVKALELSATDIFNQPCPPVTAATANDQNMHRADALDGSAKNFNVDLRMKQTVNYGAPRWWNNGGASQSKRRR